MVIVKRNRGESKDSMFRKFSKIFMDENIIDDVRDRLFYKKPSIVRKEKEKERGQRKYKKSY
ncbi:30S ribosomal protein S21 [Candidatus Roizmanbacteria bacterium RIFCSPHIGHO2_12_FULL_33_9]|uniref:Small ribosomal subunit protein bS21 n=1 Tax=Candidatus Roizmanbacteria bacterium RIFCSPHIGHO2_12_FULL_33_9 TaxID=1802045 RepID=A0A1F7HK24_9BACT|nr:MAG: 30S ribosomal protein S21 [Candidatus Roizmanbacteria bacterium RIFCSPHIGHO2_12_FULL_33_9]